MKKLKLNEIAFLLVLGAAIVWAGAWAIAPYSAARFEKHVRKQTTTFVQDWTLPAAVPNPPKDED